jgi:hypothetical protein
MTAKVNSRRFFSSLIRYNRNVLTHALDGAAPFGFGLEPSCTKPLINVSFAERA